MNQALAELATSEKAERVEAYRLGALASMEVLDSPRDEPLDLITGLIKSVLGVEVAIVSLIDAHRQWYKSHVGLPNEEVARQDTFCKSVVLSGEPLTVEDATRDRRFCENPFVVAERGIRAYASVPLTTEGQHVGTVCAIDFKPRKWAAQDARLLHDFAAVAMHLLQLRKLAATDALTGLASRRSFMDLGERALSAAKRYGSALSCVVFDVDRFKSINDSQGHAAGDVVLRAVASTCLSELRRADTIARIGGEEFAILLPNTSAATAFDVAEKLRRSIANLQLDLGSQEPQTVTASFGVVGWDASYTEFDSLMAAADRSMYIAKSQGRDRTHSTKADRTDARRRVLKAGTILFNRRSSTIDCTIRSLGKNGAGLDVTSTIGIPDRFTLRIRVDDQEHECRVAALSDRHLEVDFI